MKQLGDLEPGVTFTADYDPNTVHYLDGFVFEKTKGVETTAIAYGHTRRVAFLIQGKWHHTNGQLEHFNPSCRVQPVQLVLSVEPIKD